jgi:universal stress protein E
VKRFRNILVHADGLNGGRTALRRAVHLAQANDARLTIAEVIPELPPNIRKLQEIKSVTELEEMAREDSQERLDELLSEVDTSGLTVDKVVLTGTPYLELIRRVLTGRHDLIIKTAVQPGGLSERIFGTTGLHLLRKCPCPVWIIRPESEFTFKNILVAVNVFAEHDSETRLNYDLIQMSHSLAQSEQAHLHVVAAWELWMEAYLRTSRHMGAERVAETRRELEYSTGEKLKQLLSQMDTGSTVTTHVLNGVPEYVIPRVAREQEVDLLVMGTIGRSGLPGVFIGNTADRILSQVNCSVLALKPPGFETPVTLPHKNDE